MERRSMRVMVASEWPELRYFLRQAVEAEDRALIVGQAENTVRALTLARTLKPDVAIVDCYLPHTVGLDAIPLSRIGGLDAAQTISQEMPDIRVVLLNRQEAAVMPERSPDREVATSFSREVMGASVPFTLTDLWRDTETSGVLVFATVNARPRPVQKLAELSDKAVLFGAIGVIGGLVLLLSVIFAGAGILLAAAGAAALILGGVTKLAARFWHAPWRRS